VAIALLRVDDRRGMFAMVVGHADDERESPIDDSRRNALSDVGPRLEGMRRTIPHRLTIEIFITPSPFSPRGAFGFSATTRVYQSRETHAPAQLR